MFKITINSDDEMRKLIREEVKGAVITMGREEVLAQVKEGIRRAQGPGEESLEGLVHRTIEKVAQGLILRDLPPGFSPRREVAELIKAKFQKSVEAAVDLEVAKAMQQVDIPALIRQALSHITVSAKT